jgi:hypothetical protein
VQGKLPPTAWMKRGQCGGDARELMEVKDIVLCSCSSDRGCTPVSALVADQLARFGEHIINRDPPWQQALLKRILRDHREARPVGLDTEWNRVWG